MTPRDAGFFVSIISSSHHLVVLHLRPFGEGPWREAGGLRSGSSHLQSQKKENELTEKEDLTWDRGRSIMIMVTVAKA